MRTKSLKQNEKKSPNAKASGLQLMLSMILLLFLVISFAGCSQKTEPVTPTPTSQTIEDSVARKEVIALVETFGSRLQKVALLEPEEDLKMDLVKYYGDLVEQDLLDVWLANPEAAPGKLTSSPWPDRIEVGAVEKIDSGLWRVEGELIEVTSVEGPGGMPAALRPVEAVVANTVEGWRIQEFVMGAYEVQQTQNTPEALESFSLMAGTVVLSLNAWDNELLELPEIGTPLSESIEVLGQTSDTFAGSFVKTVTYEDLELIWTSPKDNGKTFWLMRMTTNQPTIQTPEGIRVSMTLDELKSAYKDLEQIPDGRIDPENAAYRRSLREGYQYMVFEIQKGKIVKIEVYVELP